MIREYRPGWHKDCISQAAKRIAYRTAALFWVTALLVGSLQPRRPWNIHFGMAHHVAHVLSYGVLVFLVSGAFGASNRVWVWPAVLCFLFGFSIEFLEHLQNRMPIEWYDVWDNAAGILAVASLYRMMYRPYGASPRDAPVALLEERHNANGVKVGLE